MQPPQTKSHLFNEVVLSGWPVDRSSDFRSCLSSLPAPALGLPKRHSPVQTNLSGYAWCAVAPAEHLLWSLAVALEFVRAAVMMATARVRQIAFSSVWFLVIYNNA